MSINSIIKLKVKKEDKLVILNKIITSISKIQRVALDQATSDSYFTSIDAFIVSCDKEPPLWTNGAEAHTTDMKNFIVTFSWNGKYALTIITDVDGFISIRGGVSGHKLSIMRLLYKELLLVTEGHLYFTEDDSLSIDSEFFSRTGTVE